MSSNVFLASCDSDGFDRTVGSPVDVSDYPDRPSALSDADEVRFWAVGDGDGDRNSFEKMESGDLVLFYRGDEFVGTGWIGITFVDEEDWANTTFWDGSRSSLVYTVEGFTPVSVPKSAVNRIFDYAEGYTPPELMRVADDRVTRSPEAIKLALQRYTEKNA